MNNVNLEALKVFMATAHTQIGDQQTRWIAQRIINKEKQGFRNGFAYGFLWGIILFTILLDWVNVI